MARIGGHKMTDARRLRVAQLHLRGLTQREIVMALEQQEFVNPETGKPFGLGTINRDLRFLEEQWRKEAVRDIVEHKMEQLAQVRAVIREAWAQKDLAIVLRALERQARLLGLDMPIQVDVRDIDARIERELERLATGSQATVSGEAASDPDSAAGI